MAALLTGLRILDLSSIVAGPMAGMILADLGANVIKVERTGSGEDGRAMGPYEGGWGAYFVALNRNKRSITVDLNNPQGRETVLRLAASCDVFLENFRGGKAAALGLDEASVRARRTDIIYASLSAYGPCGPDYKKPGYDAVLQARTGIMSVTGIHEGPSLRAGVSILDMGAGIWMALGVLAALIERQRSGQGQRVDASLFQTGVMLMAYHLVYRQFTGADPQPQGTRYTAFAPYGAFPTADGSVMLGISGDRAFRRLCECLGKPEWADDVRFRTNRDRLANVDDLENLIGGVMRTRPTSYWIPLLNEHEIANDAVQSAGELLNDPQLAALGQLIALDLPGAGQVQLPRLPIELSRNPQAPAEAPPRVGEHTRAILSQAGFSNFEIDDLIRCGAVESAE